MFNKLKFILTKSEKKELAVLFVGTVLLAVLETFSIGIIIPIINLFLNQEKIQTSNILRRLYNFTGVNNIIDFMTILIITAIFLFAFKSLYALFTVYKQRSFVNNIHVRVANQLLKSYLEKPYSFHLENNSAILFRNVTAAVQQFSNNLLLPLVLIGAEAVILLAIFSFLMSLYPVITLSLVTALVMVLVFISVFLKNRIRSYAAQRMEASGNVHKFGLEALHAVKEIKVYNAQRFFLDRYARNARKGATSLVKFNLVSQMPQYALETVLWTVILVILLVTIRFHKHPYEVISMMTVFGLATLRILPSVHRIYMNINTVRYYANSLDVFYDSLKEERIKEAEKKGSPAGINLFDESKDMRLERVDFGYKTASGSIFNDLNLIIPRHKTIAFAGETGAGKSTLIDILMGLLDPDKGVLRYGNTIITLENVSEYRRRISYIPQSITLIDDTLEANIAFGIQPENIDPGKLERAVQISQLESMIRDLPNGIKTVVGEKGIRLSGGQKQRVAIARALYNNPEILIMDEATSALDGHTEAEVSKAIRGLSGRLTIILIAHRMSTIECADIIYVMDKGKIIDQGTFKELLERSSAFKKIANEIKV